MHFNRMTWMAAVLGTVAISSLAGCGKDKAAELGAASINVNALTLADIASVTVVVQGATMPSPITIPLVQKGQQWSALVSSLPVGTNYSFVGSAKATDGTTELYHGSVSGQSIVKNQTANIVINMNQVAPGVGLENEAPVIDTLTATALQVGNNDTVTIKSTAHDPDAGDTAGMAWVWTSTCGTLGTPANTTGTDTTDGSSTIVFTAPATDGPCTVNLSVNDARLPAYLETKASLTIQVNGGSSTGNAKITALPNTCPVIADLRATPVPLALNAPTTIQVSASDSDGDALIYQWSSPDCTGTFANATASTTTFTLTAAPSVNNCTLLVSVSDGTFPNGDAKCNITNHLSMPVSVPAAAGSPVFGYDYQSQDTISGGDVVKMEIVAPTTGCSGGTISLAWTDTDSTPLAPIATLDPPFTAGMSYTAPSGAENGSVVTVTVTASCSLPSVAPTAHTFTLVPLNSFCFGKADNTDCTSTANAANKCVTAASCQTGVCVAQTTTTCSQNGVDQCHTNTCAPSTGSCGLVAKADNTTCNDGLNCTTGDVCTAGICGGAAAVCTQTGGQCQVNACVESTGLCALGNKANGTPCDDGNGCTGASSGPGTSGTADVCTAGACVAGSAVSCPSGDVCTATDSSHYTCPVKVCLMSNYAQQIVPPLNGLAINASVGTPWITGALYTPFNFGSGSVSSTGSADMYVAKLDPTTGLATQTFTFGDTGKKDQIGTAIAVAGNGNVGVVGTTGGEIDFSGNSQAGDTSTGVPCTAGIDCLGATAATAFYALIDGTSSGTYATAIKSHMVNVGTGALLAAASNPARNEIAFCGKTSKLVTAWADNAATQGVRTTVGAGGNTAFGGGNVDLIVFVVDATTGLVKWGKQYGGAGDQVCESLAMDGSGNVFMGGKYSGDLFGLANVADTSGNTAQLFVAKLNAADGTLASAKTWTSTGISDAFGIAVDSGGNVVMGGSIASAVDFGGGHVAAFTGLTDAFVVKFDSTLTSVWAKSTGDAGSDQGINSISLDSAGNIVAGGAFKGTLPAWGLTNTDNATVDAFLVQLHADGSLVDCAHSYGDAAGAQAIATVSVASGATGALANAIFMGGAFSNTITFGSTTLSTGSGGLAYSYVARMTE